MLAATNSIVFYRILFNISTPLNVYFFKIAHFNSLFHVKGLSHHRTGDDFMKHSIKFRFTLILNYKIIAADFLINRHCHYYKKYCGLNHYINFQLTLTYFYIRNKFSLVLMTNNISLSPLQSTLSLSYSHC